MKKLGTVALALVLGFALTSSCASKRQVTVDLIDTCAGSGSSLREQAAYQEFLVFPGQCPPDADLAGGITSGAKLSKVAPAKSALPEIGDLPKSKFGLAVLLRDEKCTVIAYGCTEADLESVGKVKIVPCGGWDADGACICAPLKGGGGCCPPTTCQSGKCVKGANPEAGACSLEVERAGALPEAAAETAQMSGPGIAATDDGFVVGYRDQNADSLRLLVSYIPDDAKMGGPSLYDLGGCVSEQVTDGVGVAYENGKGLVATSLPNCGKGAGAVVVPFNSLGVVEPAQGPRNGAFLSLQLAPGSSVAPAATVGEFELLYKVNSGGTPVVERVVLTPDNPVSVFKALPIEHPFGEDDLPFGMVATSPQVRAFLAPVNGDGGQNTLVQVGNRSTDTIDIKGQFTLPYSGSSATIAAWNNKVAAAVPASSGSNVAVVDFTNNAVGTPVTGTVGTGTVYSTAFAAMGSHLFVAQGHTGGITIHRLEGADGKVSLTPSDTVELPPSLCDVSLSTFDGTHLAMAAARNRVVVVWLTKPKLSAGDPSGGYAVLKCADK